MGNEGDHVAEKIMQVMPADVEHAQQEDKVSLATIGELFRYASGLDWFCMVVGLICSGAVGAAQPGMMVRSNVP